MASFVRATKTRSRLRLALVGPSGSGKTYTALKLAQNLAGPVAVIDTEHGSASKYADDFTFDVMELDSFAPSAYVEAIHEAARRGYGTLILDSLSHAWMGKDGALEQVDRITSAKRGNNFAAWGEVTPQHNAMIDAILEAPMHVLVTMRVKMAYVVEQDERGKQVPRRVGLQPVQRDGLEYEFDVVADMTPENVMVIGKTRCSALTGKIFPRPGHEVAEALSAWLAGGDARAPEIASPKPAVTAPVAPPAPLPPPHAAPAPPANNEATAVQMLGPKFARVRTHEELRKVVSEAIAIGGRNASAAYRAWFDQMRAQALAAIGPAPRPGPAKATSPASAPAGKAVAS